MRKIRLDVDALEVQSFFTAAQSRARGTVRGAESLEVEPETVSKPPYCWVESGDCEASRDAVTCDVLLCDYESRECAIDTADCR